MVRTHPHIPLPEPGITSGMQWRELGFALAGNQPVTDTSPTDWFPRRAPSRVCCAITPAWPRILLSVGWPTSSRGLEQAHDRRGGQRRLAQKADAGALLDQVQRVLLRMGRDQHQPPGPGIPVVGKPPCHVEATFAPEIDVE